MAEYAPAAVAVGIGSTPSNTVASGMEARNPAGPQSNEVANEMDPQNRKDGQLGLSAALRDEYAYTS